MRILAIRGKNLASLSAFDVELHRGPLAQAGLFAITGPTGAGKTTLLDAMCVALFDRTPRLGARTSVLIGRAGEPESMRLSATDVRSLLRRGAGSAYAEVDFLGRDGHHFRARWSVRRALGKAQGRLQRQCMSLRDLTSNEYLGGTKSETLEAIEQALGLSFEQFRRSALLAQNEFAAFLHASRDERSDLLERMTGTEIYSRLSIAAHERHQAEKNKLDALLGTASQLPVLTNEERSHLALRLAELGAARDQVEKRLAEVGETLRLYRDEADARQQLASAERTLAEVEQEFATHEQRKLALGRERRLREQRGHFESMASRDAELALAEADLQARKFEMSQAALKAENCAEMCSKAESLLQRRRAEYETELCSQRVDAEQCAEDANRWLRRNSELLEGLAFAAPVEPGALPDGGWDHASLVDVSVAVLEQLREELHRAFAELQRDEHRAQEQVAAATAALVDATALAQRRREEADRDDIARLRRERAREGQHRDSVRQWVDAIRSGVDVRSEIEDLEQQIQALAEVSARDTNEMSKHRQQREREGIRLDEAERALSRARVAASLDQHRLELGDGDPCPLCGSKEHPWRDEAGSEKVEVARGSRVFAEQEKRVLQLRQEQNALERRLATVEARIAATEAQAHDAQVRVKKLGAALARSMADANRLVNEMGELPGLVRFDSKDAVAIAQMRLTKLDARLCELDECIVEAETRERSAVDCEGRARARQSDLEQARAGHRALSQAAQEARRKLLRCDSMRICRRQEALRAAQERVAQVALDLARAGAKRFAETEQLEQATRERVEVELVLERARERLAAAEERHDLACKRARLAHDIVNNVLRDFAIDAATAHEWLEASQASIEARVAHLASVADRLATARATRAERELRLSELRERLTQHHGEAECAAAQKRYWVERGEIDESHGDVLARLRSDDQAIARRDAIERASRKQREQVEIFGGLAAVIGSHDGAKLRRFAQSLTLDNLLIQANLHLRELAPRYRLQRVPGEDLELQVVDGDLGDEIRGVRSLSGGETFLVSLALALGLSSLSARNTRVESLLVDEGFGALDPDALETALAVLDALRATGRQVGLISHVPGLAERFCAQVVVSKNGAGLSDVRVAASA